MFDGAKSRRSGKDEKPDDQESHAQGHAGEVPGSG